MTLKNQMRVACNNQLRGYILLSSNIEAVRARIFGAEEGRIFGAEEGRRRSEEEN
jgi:lipase chaperone LimK